MCYSVTLCQKVKKNSQKVGQKEKKVVKKLSKSSQKVAKSCQKVVPRPSASASLTGRRQKGAMTEEVRQIPVAVGQATFKDTKGLMRQKLKSKSIFQAGHDTLDTSPHRGDWEYQFTFWSYDAPVEAGQHLALRQGRVAVAHSQRSSFTPRGGWRLET
jgi:hypothetical protein